MSASTVSFHYKPDKDSKDSKDNIIITTSTQATADIAALRFRSYLEYVEQDHYAIKESNIYAATAMAVLTAAANPTNIITSSTVDCMNDEFESVCLNLFGKEYEIYFHELHFFAAHGYKEILNINNGIIFHLIQEVWRPKVIRHAQKQQRDDRVQPNDEYIMHSISLLLKKRIILFTKQMNPVVFSNEHTKELILDLIDDSFYFLSQHPVGIYRSILIKDNAITTSTTTLSTVSSRNDILIKNNSALPVVTYWAPFDWLQPFNCTQNYFKTRGRDVIQKILCYLPKQDLLKTSLVERSWKIPTFKANIQRGLFERSHDLEKAKLPERAEQLFAKAYYKKPATCTVLLEFRLKCLATLKNKKPKPKISSPDSKEPVADVKSPCVTSSVPDHHYEFLGYIIDGNDAMVLSYLNTHATATNIIDDFHMTPLFWSKLFSNESAQMMLAKKDAVLLPKDHPMSATEYFLAGVAASRTYYDRDNKAVIFAEIIADNIGDVSKLEFSCPRNFGMLPIAYAIVITPGDDGYSHNLTQNTPLANTLRILLRHGATVVVDQIHNVQPVFPMLIPDTTTMGRNSAEVISVFLQHGMDRQYFSGLLTYHGEECLKKAVCCNKETVEAFFNLYPKFCQEYFDRRPDISLHNAIVCGQFDTCRFLLTKIPMHKINTQNDDTFLHKLLASENKFRHNYCWDTYQKYIAFARESIQTNTILLSSRDSYNNTPLLRAAARGSYEALRLFNDEKKLLQRDSKENNALITTIDLHVRNSGNSPQSISTIAILLAANHSYQSLDLNLLHDLLYACIFTLQHSVPWNKSNGMASRIAIEILVKDKFFSISYAQLEKMLDKLDRPSTPLPSAIKKHLYFILLKHKKIQPDDFLKFFRLIAEEPHPSGIYIMLSERYQKGDGVVQDLLFAEELLRIAWRLCNTDPKISQQLQNLQKQKPNDKKYLADFVHMNTLDALEAQAKSLFSFFPKPHAAAIKRITEWLKCVKNKTLQENSSRQKDIIIKSLITEYTQLKLASAGEEILEPLRIIIFGLRWLPLSRVLINTKSGAGPSGTAAVTVTTSVSSITKPAFS